MNTRTFIAVAALLLCGCIDSGSSSPLDATGETPVRYILCASGDRFCFVAARFKDLDGCESHKRWSEMLCDSLSKPGEMLCKTETQPPLGVAYCTQ